MYPFNLLKCSGSSDDSKLRRSTIMTVRYAEPAELRIMEDPSERFVVWARNNNLKQIKSCFGLFSKCKVEVNFRNSAGVTALLVAATHGHTDVVKVRL